jgi:23S rRNA (adenine2503-C2)-methyltransferase
LWSLVPLPGGVRGGFLVRREAVGYGLKETNYEIMQKEKLYGKTLNELIAVTKRLGMPGFAAMQIADWLYKKEIQSIKEMTNLSNKTRDLLETEYELGLNPPVNVAESTDGTKKYLYKVLKDKYIETAYIPESDRATICVSSQAGCKMGCIFCMTGKQGFQGNLSSNEILNQFRSLPEFRNLTNMVYMGMGEPLDNINEVLKSLDILTSEWGYGWSPTRITVSTVGLIAGIKEFLEKSRCHLAVSLHSPFDEERRKLMPIQRTNTVKEVLDIIKNFEINNQRRVSFEYILFKGMNDTPMHIKELARILNGIKCRINIIRFHPIPGSQFFSPDIGETIKFKEALNAKGILTTIRASRGVDINAACGLLSTLEQNKLQ